MRVFLFIFFFLQFSQAMDWANDKFSMSQLRSEFSKKCRMSTLTKDQALNDGYDPIENKECLTFFVKHSEIMDRLYKYSYFNYQSLTAARQNSFCYSYFAAGLKISNELVSLIPHLEISSENIQYRARFEIFYSLLESYYLASSESEIKSCIAGSGSHEKAFLEGLKSLTNHTASIIRIKWGRRGLKNTFLVSQGLSNAISKRSTFNKIWDGVVSFPSLFWQAEDQGSYISYLNSDKKDIPLLLEGIIKISKISPDIRSDYEMISKIESHLFKKLSCEALKLRDLGVTHKCEQDLPNN